VEGQVVRLTTAVLARVVVTDEDLTPRQLHPWPRALDVVLQPDDGWRAVVNPRRPDDLVIELDHFGLLAEQQAEGSRQVADVERLVILVQHEHYAVHRAGENSRRTNEAAERGSCSKIDGRGARRRPLRDRSGLRRPPLEATRDRSPLPSPDPNRRP